MYNSHEIDKLLGDSRNTPRLAKSTDILKFINDLSLT